MTLTEAFKTIKTSGNSTLAQKLSDFLWFKHRYTYADQVKLAGEHGISPERWELLMSEDA